MEEIFAKILLLGEYSVLAGSRALTVPYYRYSGRLIVPEYPNDTTIISNQVLGKFFNYLQGKKRELYGVHFDFPRFARDINDGLYFDSSIPLHYGLGSSGSLVAAVFRRYADPKMQSLASEKLKELLAIAESFFHGRSSGIDPLTSFLSKPLLFDRQKISEITPDIYQNIKSRFYLFNSGTGSETTNFVKVFHAKMENRAFANRFKEEYVKQVNITIEKFAGVNTAQTSASFTKLSGMQLHYFREMIPDAILPMWETGINRGSYAMKLCGSGGGGYFLIYSQLPISQLNKHISSKLLPI